MTQPISNTKKKKRRKPKLDDVPSIRQYEDLIKRLYYQAKKRPTIENVLPLVVAVTGCRISECLNLTTIDIDEEHGYIYLKTAKGGEGAKRAIPVPRWLFDIVDRYIRYNGIGYKLFNISRVQAWRIIKKQCGVRPHALRHAFAMYMLFHGKDPELVRRLMGHSDWKMVAEYVEKVQIDKRFSTPLEELQL